MYNIVASVCLTFDPLCQATAKQSKLLRATSLIRVQLARASCLIRVTFLGCQVDLEH